MVCWCKFNKPDDKLTDAEHYQYIYAMQIWELQDKLGLTFPEAAIEMENNRSYHDRYTILEYYLKIDDPDLLCEAYEKISKEYWESHKEVFKWRNRNIRRFGYSQEPRPIQDEEAEFFR